jgi:hypothetical protein
MALTLEDLQADPHLNPGRLLGYFSDFKFQLGDNIQKPEVFLAKKCGDCDDFATLASDLLARKGYTPRLVAVYMEREVHVVCYVTETNSYLEYNNRTSRKLVPSSGRLADIAEKVANGFKTNWHSVSEFTFANGRRRFVATEFR